MGPKVYMCFLISPSPDLDVLCYKEECGHVAKESKLISGLTLPQNSDYEQII